jgi:phosphoribosylformylglycinamidine cyclo-ligase
MVRRYWMPARRPRQTRWRNRTEKRSRALLYPTKIYVKPVLDLLERVEEKGIAHITAGLLLKTSAQPEDRMGARIERSAEPPRRSSPPHRYGGIPEREMYNTFNMGVGMVIIVSPGDAGRGCKLAENGEDANSWAS